MSEMKINNISDYFKKDDKDKNNSSNEISISYLHQKNNLKNKRAVNKMNKKLKINSISELEFLYNDSQNKTTITNKPIKLRKKNFINLSPNIVNSTSGIITKKNKKFSRQSKSQSSFKIFWESQNQLEKERQSRINNLKAESIMKQNSLMLSRPKISKKSITLANQKKREPLYLKRPLNEEIYLDEEFLKFYKKNLDFTKDETKWKEDEKKIEEKFNKFYEDNINWKKQRNDKLENLRNQNKTFETQSYSFKPIINKNSIRLVKKIEQINNIYSSEQSINLNNSKYEKELLNQLKAKLKPLLIGCYEIYNNRIPNISKRSQYLVRKSLSSNVTKRQNRNKTFQKLQKTNMIKNIKKQRNRTIEEKKNDSLDIIKEKRNKFVIKRTYDGYLKNKFKEIDSKNKKNKKELYKLNVRQGTSCNPNYINKIIPKNDCNYIFKSMI